MWQSTQSERPPFWCEVNKHVPIRIQARKAIVVCFTRDERDSPNIAEIVFVFHLLVEIQKFIEFFRWVIAPVSICFEPLARDLVAKGKQSIALPQGENHESLHRIVQRY